MKPDFFLDEDLAELPLWVRVLYEGLWCHADKEGRLEDRPQKLKAVIFPYDKYDVNDGLQRLSQPKVHSPKHLPFIVHYEVNGERYIQILSWDNHQSPHHTEKESSIPPYNGGLTVIDTLDKGRRGDAHYQETINLISKSEQERILAYFNETTGQKRKADTGGLIAGRLADGRTFEDFKHVIDTKTAQWRDDQKMHVFIRPSTLFRPSNFEDYLNEPYQSPTPAKGKDGRPPKTDAERETEKAMDAKNKAYSEKLRAEFEPKIESAMRVKDIKTAKLLSEQMQEQIEGYASQVLRGEKP